MSKAPDFSNLSAIFVNCTLKKSPRLSHTQGLWQVAERILENHHVTYSSIRAVDYDIAPGVQPDMTTKGVEKDDWPELSKRILAADILIIGTPIWLGERSSVCSRVIERLYALSGHTNEKGQYLYYGKVGGCIVTGNEDGVKHCSMTVLYALQHLGYTIPPQADAGWIGKIGPGPSYLDEDSGGPESNFTNRNTTFMTYNLLHLAWLLKENGGIPAYGNQSQAWSAGERWKFENPHSTAS